IGEWGLGPIPNPQSPIPTFTKYNLSILNKLNIYSYYFYYFYTNFRNYIFIINFLRTNGISFSFSELCQQRTPKPSFIFLIF
ncbi:MAG: hypothetical protein MJ252_21020, partial [archaeon]|nr:hypothetical protein [archaeon]